VKAVAELPTPDDQVITAHQRWLSAAEVAEAANVSLATINRWTHRGSLPGHRINGPGRPWRYSESAVGVARELANTIPEWRRNGPPPSPFRDALKAALARSAMTLAAAAAAAGVGENTVLGWSAGRHIPFRDDLERLSRVVGEPRLVDLIESRHRFIRLVCRNPKCGRTRDARPGEVRQSEKHRAPGSITVDWQKGEGQDTCVRCTNSQQLKRMQHNLAKREGKQALRDHANKHLGSWRTKNPDKQRKLQQAATAAAAAAPKSPVAIARQRLAQFSLEPAGEFGLCALCHKLVFVWDEMARGRYARGSQIIGKFHRTCFSKWTKGPEYREYKRARRSAQRSGRRRSPMPMPPRPSTRMTAPTELAKAYATTIQYFRQRVGSNSALRDDSGELLDIKGLADALDVPRSAIYKRKQRFLDLLPGEEVATGQVKKWREVLFTLEAAYGESTTRVILESDRQTGDTLHKS
jgi:excisionase family DNA binding protein